MKKSPAARAEVFRRIWDKYNDTLWKLEQSWNDSAHDYVKRTTLTESVLEMIRIEKRLRTIEIQRNTRMSSDE